ncbi:nucleoside triphosphate pyrophosphohydrolase [Actinomadura kijaniata]|uniref:Putative house-cleaning noncanonical NTP pyrophosphatase (MazG superfamily) n=1 Tax=Actinomadura namibiensis TaxID=182080 RepID=A0A7W3QRP3_ACTNM|nr:nucleoside triphosphate pyrophosphohydrolase [Actinomadura namibiensis]MBA8956969.1 putative house-cleaning noncanonical NTP pyrophosphatase (MazG superfamily) [Actinomadura namibiensis]
MSATGHIEKLVRDRIPEIIRASGATPDARVAAEDEYATLLRAKLHEEVAEYTAENDPAELADILEVLHALAALHDLTPEELEALRAAKASERGGFQARVVLQVPTPPPHPAQTP